MLLPRLALRRGRPHPRDAGRAAASTLKDRLCQGAYPVHELAGSSSPTWGRRGARRVPDLRHVRPAGLPAHARGQVPAPVQLAPDQGQQHGPGAHVVPPRHLERLPVHGGVRRARRARLGGDAVRHVLHRDAPDRRSRVGARRRLHGAERPPVHARDRGGQGGAHGEPAGGHPLGRADRRHRDLEHGAGAGGPGLGPDRGGRRPAGLWPSTTGRTPSASGIRDYDAQSSQRPIAIHALEHLASTDRGVIMLRKIVPNSRPHSAGRSRSARARAVAGAPIATVCQDTVLRIPPSPDPEADRRLLLETGRRVVHGRTACGHARTAMPELPDVTVYVEALAPRIVGRSGSTGVRLASPFVLRTVRSADSTRGAAGDGRRAAAARQADRARARGRPLPRHPPDDRRAGCAGSAPGAKPPGKVGLAAFDFPTGTLVAHRGGHEEARVAPPGARARTALAALDPGGLEVLEADAARRSPPRCARENHTLKRALTDPRLFSGIGNAYSDEILHRARLSPLAADVAARRRGDRRGSTTPTREVARRVDRAAARARRATAFPEKVTAFREGMAVHGRFGKPCPVCGAPVQRIRLRRQRDQLLRALPDRRPAARRPSALAAAPRRLAAHARRARRAPLPVTAAHIRSPGVGEGLVVTSGAGDHAGA